MKMSATDWLLLIMVILGVMLGILSHRAKQNVERITATDTITVTNTITNWRHDTVYINRFDTIKLPIVDTINDTIIKIDSILVQLPINTYHYDTIISDSTHTTSLRADIEGFAVRLEQLSIHTEITPQITKKQHWYGNLCPAAGIGLGTGGAGIFIGVGYKIF